jgi:hypothetical protein
MAGKFSTVHGGFYVLEHTVVYTSTVDLPQDRLACITLVALTRTTYRGAAF